MPNAEGLKESAALRALDLVCDGMSLGLGTGSTAAKFVEALGGRVADGLMVLCVPTSERTATLAHAVEDLLHRATRAPKLSHEAGRALLEGFDWLQRSVESATS